MMQTEDTKRHADGRCDLSPMESTIKKIEIYLEKRRIDINEEIRSYPTPIPACDAQFNYLLEQRTKLSQELDRLHGIGSILSEESAMIQLIQFIESSDWIPSDFKHQLLEESQNNLLA